MNYLHARSSDIKSVALEQGLPRRQRQSIFYENRLLFLTRNENQNYTPAGTFVTATAHAQAGDRSRSLLASRVLFTMLM